MSSYAKGILITVMAVLVLSPDAVLVRLAGLDLWTLLFWRSLFASAGFFLLTRVRAFAGMPEPTDTLQRNSRFGLTFVFPFRRRHALKASYSTGVVTESGGIYSSFVVGYNVLLR